MDVTQMEKAKKHMDPVIAKVTEPFCILMHDRLLLVQPFCILMHAIA